MYNRILVAIDVSENSHKALDHAVFVADKLGAELTILATIPRVIPFIPFDESGIIPPSIIDELTSQKAEFKITIQDILNEAFTKIRTAHPNLNLKTTLREGLLSNIILDMSEKEGYDLIVIFRTDNGYLTRLISGSESTIKRVIASCKKPILVIK